MTKYSKLNNVDPVEELKSAVVRRLVACASWDIGRIYGENLPFTVDPPFCRISLPQGAEFSYDSQTTQSKNIICQLDIFDKALNGTKRCNQLAFNIENAFGGYSRDYAKRVLKLSSPDLSAVVYKFGRSTSQSNSEKQWFYVSVLLYVKLTILF